jgi:type IV pilus assembly protein PilW
MERPRRLHPPTGPAGQLGLSMVELMVGIAVGLVVVAGITTFFVNSSRAKQELEKSSQQVESGRYAIQLLVDELRMAGYYGELDLSDTDIPVPPVDFPDPCATDPAGPPFLLRDALALPVQGYDNGDAAPACVADLKPGTDILVIRRTSGCVCDPATGACLNGALTGVASGNVLGVVPGTVRVACGAVDITKNAYLQSNLCERNTDSKNQVVLDYDPSKFVLQKADCASTAVLRPYYTHIYFVANNHLDGDGVPTLKVAELGGGAFSISPLVEGVEQMQVEYGIDSNPPVGDGVPDAYTADPNTFNGCADPACQMGNWQNVTTVKLNLVARSTEQSQGYEDAKTYTLGKNADGSDNMITFPDATAYKRHAYSSAAVLNNVAGRRR